MGRREGRQFWRGEEGEGGREEGRKGWMAEERCACRRARRGEFIVLVDVKRCSCFAFLSGFGREKRRGGKSVSYGMGHFRRD